VRLSSSSGEGGRSCSNRYWTEATNRRKFLQEYGSALARVLKQTDQDVDAVALDSLLQRKVGKSRAENFGKTVWMHFLRTKRLILIDTPDYSKTDRRAMATDLGNIYWLWNNFTRTCETKPNIVVAVQKEMFGSHFFFDKMHKIELEPLEPVRMLEAYVKRFNGTWPFTQEALMTLARMSRGIFRRFQRYIMLTVRGWQTGSSGQGRIDVATVREAVTLDRLAEDMELELSEVCPKHADLRLQAVRAIIRLEESGPITQELLAEQLGVERYAVSRLLSKLELHKYVTRERVGSEKVVRLTRH
jgi:CRP-like cAMP-binding protein